MKKLRDIQAEEENQRKQVQKLQAEMKTKPFLYDNKGNLVFIQKPKNFNKNYQNVEFQTLDKSPQKSKEVKKNVKDNKDKNDLKDIKDIRDIQENIEIDRSKMANFNTTNIQPNVLDIIKLNQGVTIKGLKAEVKGPEIKYETMSKDEYKKKYADNSDNVLNKDESHIEIKEDKLNKIENKKESFISKKENESVKKDISKIENKSDNFSQLEELKRVNSSK